jgi:hypothetical protein
MITFYRQYVPFLFATSRLLEVLLFFEDGILDDLRELRATSEDG